VEPPGFSGGQAPWAQVIPSTTGANEVPKQDNEGVEETKKKEVRDCSRLFYSHTVAHFVSLSVHGVQGKALAKNRI